MVAPLSLTSPSLSPSSSYDMISSYTRSSTGVIHDDVSSSDDEIVWSIANSGSSDDEDNNNAVSLASDDDFVVLSRSISPTLQLLLPGAVAPVSDLVSRISRLALGPSCTATQTTNVGNGSPAGPRAHRSRRRGVAQVNDAYPSPTPSPAPLSSAVPIKPPSGANRRKAKAARAAATSSNSTLASDGSPSRRITRSMTRSGAVALGPAPRTATVTPLRLALPSEAVSAEAKPVKGTKKAKDPVPSANANAVASASTGLGERPAVVPEKGDAAIEDASKYITSFLTSNEAKETTPRLPLLHALIVELGICPPTSTLPTSLTAAKALLKSHAFLNIREYINVREEGPGALKAIMHPSRKALVKSIRQKRNPASLKWVKKNGLQVLLVTCF